jgi:hypothetical protein
LKTGAQDAILPHNPPMDRETTKGSMAMSPVGGRGGMKMEWTTK